jgi:hypothetical protein
MSGRAIEKKHHVGRRTIIKALSSAWPEPRRQLPPRASQLDPFKPAIDLILKADLDAPRKQRHTIARIYHRLMDEHGMADVSYPVVRAYVAERKLQVRAEAGRGPAEVFVPHRPGDEAEVDFGEVVVRLAGERQTPPRTDRAGRRRRRRPGLPDAAPADHPRPVPRPRPGRRP